MHKLFLAVLIALFALPLLWAAAMSVGSGDLSRAYKRSLHDVHFDTRIFPNRETRRANGIGRWAYMLVDETGAITLAESQKATQDDIQAGVIDEFRKSSYLLENMTFDDAVSPGTNQATLTYGYTRLVTQPTAAFRDYNVDYTPQEVSTTRVTTELVPFGGAFEIDRVLNVASKALYDTLQLNITQKSKAARALFHQSAIMGETAVDGGFDGLDIALTGSTTEIGAAALEVADGLDWTAIATQADAFAAMAWLDDLVASLDERPDAILGNKRSILKIKQIARYAGYRTESEDAFGRKVAGFDGIALIDLGERVASTNPVIPIESRDLDAGGGNPTIPGLTDLYAVRFGLDGFHGVSLAGQAPVQQYLDEFKPNWMASGAVRRGEVEMVSAVALKATKAAAVLRHVKVQ